jgi:hypothetical protein
MWPYALATLRQAYRSPLAWALAALGAFAGWFAATTAILALDEVGEQALPLVVSTSHLAGVLLVLWLVGRGLEEDRHSGFAAAADATGPGTAGRLLGRWAGATLAGTTLALAVGGLLSLLGVRPGPAALSLFFTSIQATALVGAWAVLAGSLARAGGAALAVFVLWVLGHLPWGTAPFLEGAGGRALAAWLPGPRDAATAVASLGYTSAAVAGLLLATVALSRSAD